jgi:hypothetical protein
MWWWSVGKPIWCAKYDVNLTHLYHLSHYYLFHRPANIRHNKRQQKTAILNAVTKNRIRTAGIYIPLLSGTLSVIGSGSILYSIWARRHTKMKDPQHRILGMMSIFDILYSTNKAFMFLTYPSELGVPTFGNDATCALQGFLTQMGYAGGTYNLVLSVYYYLIINQGMKKEDFAKVWEKILHGIVVTCHVSFAIVGVSIGLFNPTQGFCYITPGPYGCQTNPDVPCRFEHTAAYFYEAFAQGWIQVAFVGIIVTNLLISLYVRRQEKQMDKYRTQLAPDQLSSMERTSSYARNAFIQSILYVGAFLLTWGWATIFHLLGWITGVSVPWITLVISTFLPLQGFFNAFIYARPRYIRLKKRNGHLTFKQLIKLVFLPEEERGRSTMRVSRDRIGASRKTYDSGVFRSFLSTSSNLRKSSNATSVEVVQETNGDDWTDNQLSPAVDDEEGKNERTKAVEWAENQSPAVDEEEGKIEEGEQPQMM